MAWMDEGGSGYSPPTWVKPDSENEYGYGSQAVRGHIEELEKDKDKYFRNSKGDGTPGNITDMIFAIRSTEVGSDGTGAAGASADAGQQMAMMSYPAGQNFHRALAAIIGTPSANGQGGSGFVAAYQAFLNSYAQVINGLFVNAGFHDKAERDSQMPDSAPPPPANVTAYEHSGHPGRR